MCVLVQILAPSASSFPIVNFKVYRYERKLGNHKYYYDFIKEWN